MLEQPTRLPHNVRVHLCVSLATQEAGNADALLRAEGEIGTPLISRLTVMAEGDALGIAHELASSSPPINVVGGQMECGVMLVNGASRTALGNKWYTQGALQAIDENLHRRSWTMAATSFVLNNWPAPGSPSSDRSLRERVREVGGTVYDES